VTVLICSSLLVLTTAQPNHEPVGKEIASTIKELIMSHKNDIQEFIIEKKVDGAQTNEERLNLIDEYINQTLKTKIEEINLARQELIAKLEADEITIEEFRVEMKALAQEMVATAKTMGGLGERLGALGKDVAEANRERAQQLISGLQEFARQMEQAGQNIRNQMSERALNMPELSVIPQIPNIPHHANKP
jgi:translation initiation factor 2B subunit (eIF-2B alpha/beta/delta family)